MKKRTNIVYTTEFKQFGEIKNEFITEFSNILTESDIDFIDKIYYIRNMLGHVQYQSQEIICYT
ncbi:hypothetical protein ACU6S9_19065, partial [Acinetobacter baumannii]